MYVHAFPMRPWPTHPSRSSSDSLLGRAAGRRPRSPTRTVSSSHSNLAFAMLASVRHAGARCHSDPRIAGTCRLMFILDVCIVSTLQMEPVTGPHRTGRMAGNVKVGRFVRHRDTIIVSICCAQSTSSSVRFALVCEETRIALVWLGLKCPNLAKSKTHIGDVYVRFALVCKETRIALVFKFSNLAKSKTHIGDVYVRFALVCEETRIALVWFGFEVFKSGQIQNAHR